MRNTHVYYFPSGYMTKFYTYEKWSNKSVVLTIIEWIKKFEWLWRLLRTYTQIGGNCKYWHRNLLLSFNTTYIKIYFICLLSCDSHVMRWFFISHHEMHRYRFYLNYLHAMLREKITHRYFPRISLIYRVTEKNWHKLVSFINNCNNWNF